MSVQYAVKWLDAHATVVVAVFTALTFLVYLQIERVMRRAFQSEYRPLVKIEPISSASAGEEGAWQSHVKFRNVGRGYARCVQARLDDPRAVDGRRYTDLADLAADGEATEATFRFREEPKPTRGGGDVSVRYEDIFGNRFETTMEGRGRRMRFRQLRWWSRWADRLR